MRSKSVAYRASLLALLAGFLMCPLPGYSQTTDTFGPAPGRAVQAVDKLADQLDAYYAKNKGLPRIESDMDKFLTDNYESAVGTPLASQEYPKPKGNCRTLPGIAMWIDPRVSNLVRINNIWQFPSDWSSPATLSIVTDGSRNYVVYLGQQGKPAGVYKVGQPGASTAGASAVPDSSKPTTKPESEPSATKPAETKPVDFDFGLGKPPSGSILSPDN